MKHFEDQRQVKFIMYREKSKIRARKTRMKKKDLEKNLQEQVNELLIENEGNNFKVFFLQFNDSMLIIY